MEGIKLIGISICITAVVTSIFSMLVPNGKIDKTLNFAISIFFLTSLVSPFFNSKLNFHVDLTASDQEYAAKNIESEMNKQFLSIAERQLESSLEKSLKEKNIFADKIDLSININADNSISINKVNVWLEKESENIMEIYELIEEATGIAPQILIQRTE